MNFGIVETLVSTSTLDLLRSRRRAEGGVPYGLGTLTPDERKLNPGLSTVASSLRALTAQSQLLAVSAQSALRLLRERLTGGVRVGCYVGQQENPEQRAALFCGRQHRELRVPNKTRGRASVDSINQFAARAASPTVLSKFPLDPSGEVRDLARLKASWRPYAALCRLNKTYSTLAAPQD